MEWVAIVMGLALLQYFFFGFMVGKAHARTGISAPIMTGDPDLDRHVRVHANTQECLMIFLPGLWLFATYVNPLIAAAIGLVFIIGRHMFYRGYIQDPAKRGPGFAVSALSFAVLLIGGMIGAAVQLI